ncbi:MAG: DUF6541 family protein [Nanoarchaeota archaeon]
MRGVSKVELFIILAIYLGALWLWTQPIQENQLPYGEADAASHFVVADAQSSSDHSLTTLPYYIDVRYGWDNQFRPHTLWYHPPYHMNFALLQIFSGSRFLPIYLFNAILCTIMVLGTYFFMRKLFGLLPAILSSILLIFSGRDYMVFLWGQWPERISYAFIPIILYAYFKYTEGYFAGKPKAYYLSVMGILIGVNFYLHPGGLFHTLAALGVFTLVLLIKERKIPFRWKHLAIAAFIFIVMAAAFPFQTMSVIKLTQTEKADAKNLGKISRLFEWYPDAADFNGAVPPTYFSYKDMNGIWTLPFLLAGIVLLLIRRKRQDWLLLSWLLSLYIMIHLDVIGKGRVHRSLAAEAHIFYPIIAIGFVWLITYLIKIMKLPKPVRPFLKMAAAIIFIIVAIMVNGKAAYGTLHNAYGGISRITPAQVEVAEWMKGHLADDALTEDFGTLTITKKRFMQFIAHRHLVKINFDDDLTEPDHLLFDYSDLVYLQQDPRYAPQITAMQEQELLLEGKATLLYDKNLIKVFKLE